MTIRQARLDRGWTQRDLVDHLKEVGVEVPVSSITHIETKGTTRADVAEALSSVLEIQVSPIARRGQRFVAVKRRRDIQAAIELLISAGYSVKIEGSA